MQYSLQIPSNSYRFPFQWKSHIQFQNPTFQYTQIHYPKPLHLSNSLKSDDLRNDEMGIAAHLPVVIRIPGGVFRYVWDGERLQLVRVDGENLSNSAGFIDYYLGNWFSLCRLNVRNFFIPQRVSENYLNYVKWKFSHRVFSSALQVLATQAMFRAMGVGYSRSLPSAAALNWLLKDGLGRLSRCIYTACFASAFDTNLKRVRFMTSVLFSMSIGVEMLTPAFPQYFLLLGFIANIGKQISFACYLATNSAVHQSFAIADNIGEISAKAQIQTVCFDNLGLMLAALLNIFCKNSQRLQAGLPFVAYPIFAVIDLYGIYHGLKHVHLRTLTKNRLEIIMNTWIQSGYVPSPAAVSEEEGIDLLWRKDREPWPIRIGCLNPNDSIPKLSMLTMRFLNEDDVYFICMEIGNRGLTKITQKAIRLYVREGASTADVSVGLLQACYVRKRLLSSDNELNNSIEAHEVSDAGLKEWFKLIEDSKKNALSDANFLNEQMLESGWSIKNILLSKHEQVRYSYLPN